MLTGTYAMVALSLEHNQLQAEVLALQQQIQDDFLYQSTLSDAAVRRCCAELGRLLRQCQQRKATRHLYPALRGQGAGQALLAQAEAWQAAAQAALRDAEAASGAANAAAVSARCACLDTVCSALLERLTLEEQHLLPLARARLSEECWFQLAHQMLAEAAATPGGDGRAAARTAAAARASI
ncbi:hypothetical protein [Massilia sp. TS11]|uniref:hypothetical protein n=1 Tax=Massilia sp. TS11 TaxID=2908003 RepID=UPI001EDB1E2F|nr:hypothetical protein [Massilia sp. TS11]MCG2583361.1 hypothetical protein [Massilia sp. TS11]